MTNSATIWKELPRVPNSPLVVAEVAFAPSLPRIQTELLEPGPIEPSQRGLLAGTAVCPVLAVMFSSDARSHRRWDILVIVSLATYFRLHHPPICNALPVLRNSCRDLITGPGWRGQLKRRSRWTAGDSLMILFRLGADRNADAMSRDANSSLVVRMTGPPGVRDIHL